MHSQPLRMPMQVSAKPHRSCQTAQHAVSLKEAGVVCCTCALGSGSIHVAGTPP